MRYGSPSIESVLKALAETGIKTLRYVPLYPHWAMSTTETSVVEAERVLAELGHPFELEVQPPFYDDPEYIEALEETARTHLQPDDHLLFQLPRPPRTPGAQVRSYGGALPKGGKLLRGALTGPRDLLSPSGPRDF